MIHPKPAGFNGCEGRPAWGVPLRFQGRWFAPVASVVPRCSFGLRALLAFMCYQPKKAALWGRIPSQCSRNHRNDKVGPAGSSSQQPECVHFPVDDQHRRCWYTCPHHPAIHLNRSTTFCPPSPPPSGARNAGVGRKHRPTAGRACAAPCRGRALAQAARGRAGPLPR